MVQDLRENCWLGKVVILPQNGGFRIEALFSGAVLERQLNQPDTAKPVLNHGDLVQVCSTGKRKGQEEEPTITLIAKAGGARAKVYTILQDFEFDPCFPPACEAEAAAWLDSPGIDDESLQDLTDLAFVTIDNADSRDLDQAIYIELCCSDSTDAATTDHAVARVYYALADASYYVRPGSALFREALRRTVTYYAPDTAVPMLPRSMSEGLVSLNPGVKRRALVFCMTVDSRGTVTDTKVTRARIESRAKLSYEGVQHFIDQSKTDKHEHPYFKEAFQGTLLALETVGELRITEAETRNVVNYDRTEASVSIDDRSRFVISERQRFGTERFNEQVSLMCNMEGAKLLSQQQGRSLHLHSIFRVHGAPLEQRLKHLRSDISELARARGLGEEWHWQQDQGLANYLDNLDKLGGVSSSQASNGESGNESTAMLKRVIERMILLTNRASLFSDEPGPHHALGVSLYARFSSPMREVVGIFLHKELLESLGLATEEEKPFDADLQDIIIERSNLARKQQKKLEQETRLLAIEQYFNDDLKLALEQRPARIATIMGMRGGKIYLSVDGFGSDIKVYTDDLGKFYGCRYRINGFVASAEKGKKTASGVAPDLITGDRLTIKTLDYDTERKRFVFVPATV